jgi:hypothetical protein
VKSAKPDKTQFGQTKECLKRRFAADYLVAWWVCEEEERQREGEGGVKGMKV